MACKRSEQCDHADICQYAKSNAYDILGGSCYCPKKPMTNEEYFKSCNTEQLAEAILQQWIHGAYHGVGEFGLTDKEIESARDGIIEWLKEKRDESV